MTKHTPKPWVMVGPRGRGFNRNYGICHESPGHIGGEFATVHTLHNTPEAYALQDANAHLLTAAPEMLAGLEDIVIKATRQRKQLSRLLDLFPECPVVRTALTENALIVNGAKRAIAAAKGKTS